jgi:hypothetical protein
MQTIARLLRSPGIWWTHGYARLATDTITYDETEMSDRTSGSYDEKTDVKIAVHGAAADDAALGAQRELRHRGQHHLDFKNEQVDTAAALVAGQDEGELDPAEARRIRKKIDWHILPMMCSAFVP